MLADDELLAGSYLDEPLRGDGAEAASAGVAVEDGDHGEVVVDALAYAVVGAHGPGVDLGRGLLPLLHEGSLFLGGGLYDVGELLFLDPEVFLPHLHGVPESLYGSLLVEYGRAGLGDVLLGDLAEVALVLDFLVDGVVLAAVGDVVKLLLVFRYLLVELYDGLLAGGDVLVEFVDELRLGGDLRVEGREVGLELRDFGRKLSAKLDYLVYLRVGCRAAYTDMYRIYIPL